MKNQKRKSAVIVGFPRDFAPVIRDSAERENERRRDFERSNAFWSGVWAVLSVISWGAFVGVMFINLTGGW